MKNYINGYSKYLARYYCIKTCFYEIRVASGEISFSLELMQFTLFVAPPPLPLIKEPCDIQ